VLAEARLGCSVGTGRDVSSSVSAVEWLALAVASGLLVAGGGVRVAESASGSSWPEDPAALDTRSSSGTNASMNGSTARGVSPTDGERW
jgi:hypothetical protein